MIEIKLKKCNGECKLEKPETSEYFHWRNHLNRFDNKCKECINQKRRDDREKKRELLKPKDKYTEDGFKLKICNGECGLEKPETKDYFYLQSNSKFRSDCKVCAIKCMMSYNAKNSKKISEQRKNYYKEHKEDRLEYNRNHKDEKEIYNKKYKEDHKIETSEYNKKYKKEHIKEIQIYARKYEKDRKLIDPAFKLRRLISSQIATFLGEQKSINGKAGRSCWEYFPYTPEELIKHIESLFEPWMNWQNHGKYNRKTWNEKDQNTWTWQLDHIIPQSELPYKTMKSFNFKKSWDLSNLRPLRSDININDGSKRTRHKNKKTTQRKVKNNMFSTNCTTRGCGRFMEPYLDPQTNEVHCSECNGAIQNISSFTKTSMKAMKQVRKSVKEAFSVRCVKCKVEALPKISDTNKLICVSCNSELNISKPFETLVRQAIKVGKQDI